MRLFPFQLSHSRYCWISLRTALVRFCSNRFFQTHSVFIPIATTWAELDEDLKYAIEEIVRTTGRLIPVSAGCDLMTRLLARTPSNSVRSSSTADAIVLIISLERTTTCLSWERTAIYSCFAFPVDCFLLGVRALQIGSDPSRPALDSKVCRSKGKGS